MSVKWSAVGGWIKENAGAGAALVGSLITGNVPGAVAAGVALVSSATGTDDPTKALESLKSDPATVIRLRELAIQEEAGIRGHIEAMESLRLKDEAASHHETQETIRGGDVAGDSFVRRTRPAQSWLSLIAGLCYIFYNNEPDFAIVSIMFTLPLAYAGLRQIDKSVLSLTNRK